MRATRISLLAVSLAALAAGQSTSQWVHLERDGRLQYSADARGNRIMDFSHAGYKGGGVRIPVERAARTLEPAPGDNTGRIQAAIDAVAGLAPDAPGFRGAVLLKSGVYEVAGALTIAASGVVLRGAGSDKNGTVIRMTGAPHRFLDIRGEGSWQTDGEAAAISDAYIPVGADTFQMKVPSNVRPGDTVLVRRPVTEAWIRFMGMDTLIRDGKQQTWIRAGSAIQTDRTIRAVTGNRVTLDVPLSDSFDSQYLNPPGATVVKYAFPGRISQAGVESLRVTAPDDDVPSASANTPCSE